MQAKPEAKKEISDLIKIVVWGGASGKTSLISRFVDDKFPLETISTIGSHFKIKKSNFHGKDFKLMIKDITGQFRFIRIGLTYTRDIDALMLVYSDDVNGSFENLMSYYNAVEIYHEDIPTIVVRNKSDLDEFSSDQKFQRRGQDLANEINAIYIETSAKTGENVSEAFEVIVDLYIKSKKPDLTNQEDHSESATSRCTLM